MRRGFEKMVLNEPGGQQLEWQDSWLPTKHARLFSDMERIFDSCGFSAEET